MPSSDEPGVSVVVAHYGDPGPTARIVEELRSQHCHRPIEVIVVDDASPVPAPTLPGDVRVVRRATNGGYGSAVDDGADLATHELLLVLNNDVTLGPTAVEDLVVGASTHQPCVAGPVTVEAGRFLLTGRRFPRPWRHAVESLAVLHRWTDRAWYARLIGRDVRCRPGVVVPDVEWLQGSALLVPTAQFRAVGGFDPRYYLYSEEIDLQRRLRGRGVRAVYVGTVEIGHAGGGATDTVRRTEWLVRSQHTYAARWGFGTRLRAALLAVAAINVVWSSARRAAGKDAAPLRALRHEVRLALLRPWPEPAAEPGRATGPAGRTA